MISLGIAVAFIGIWFIRWWGEYQTNQCQKEIEALGPNPNIEDIDRIFYKRPPEYGFPALKEKINIINKCQV